MINGQISRACLQLIILTLVVAGILPSATAATVIIGEFRLRGSNGGNDEFVELYNAGMNPVDVGGWKLKGSSASGSVAVRAALPAGTVIGAGCHYLLTNSGGPYSGAVAGDQIYTLGIADDGGIGLTLPDDSVVDQVGMSAGSFFQEGATLAPMTTNQDRSYERRPGGAAGHATDTNDNAADFVAVAPSGPQSSQSSCVAASATPSNTVPSTSTPSRTASETQTALATSTPTAPASLSPTASATTTPTQSPTVTATSSATISASATATLTPSCSATQSPSRTATVSCTATATSSRSPTPSTTATSSATRSATVSPTASPSPTVSSSPTPSAHAPQCGNGVVEPGEHCDDGNSADGDTCPGICHFGRAGLLIRGNARPRAANRDGCLVAWQLAAADLQRDRYAMPGLAQSCIDQDESCDFDPAPGRCRFLLRLCVNSSDSHLPSCRAASVERIDVLAPRAVTAERAQNRSSISAAVASLDEMSFARPDVCSAPFAVEVLVGSRSLAREQLLVRAFKAGKPDPRGHLSRLRLTCRRQR